MFFFNLPLVTRENQDVRTIIKCLLMCNDVNFMIKINKFFSFFKVYRQFHYFHVLFLFFSVKESSCSLSNLRNGLTYCRSIEENQINWIDLVTIPYDHFDMRWYYIIQYRIMLNYIIFNYIIFKYIIFNNIILYHITLYYNILYYMIWQDIIW